MSSGSTKNDADTTNTPDRWSSQAELYSNQAAKLTELHGADLVTILKDEILRSETIVDVGCGTGAFVKAYMQQFPKGVPGQTLILSDLSEGMLQKAQETVNPPPAFQTKILFQVEDGTKLNGIPDDWVDMVVSLFGVFLIPDTEATLRAIKRVLKKKKTSGDGVFANASWMFGVSEYFTSKGFGVSLQDAFQLSNQVIVESNDDEKPDFMKWSTPEDVQGLLNDHWSQVRCFPAIHNTVWDFGDLWTMMSRNPMSPIPNASDEDKMKAKRALEAFVTQNGQLSLGEPIMLSTASVLTIARGI